MTKSTLLIELGTEELPPESLLSLMQAWQRLWQEALGKNQLGFGDCKAFASPRRLAIVVTECDNAQPAQHIERFGPFVKAAYDDKGEPTKAALGFAKSCGIELSQAETKSTDKGDKLYYQKTAPGESLAALVSPMLASIVKALPVKKAMRWQSYDFSFVRPVHWIVAMSDTDVLPVKLFDLSASNQTYGHRYHAPEAITLTHANQYEESLTTTGYVLPDFMQRRELIRNQIDKLCSSMNARAVIDEALLDKVTAMVEWPTALMAGFDEKYLEVPACALIAAIKDHQSCFHCLDKNDRLLPKFITVSNIESKSPQAVIAGNERVMHARLADAAFFFNTDKKVSLDKWGEQLGNVVFEKTLGSLGEKVSRITQLAEHLASTLGADAKACTETARYCKADLMSDMVGEFPELQGEMGREYARAAGMDNAVADAIAEHYQPANASDNIAPSLIGRIVGLADRLDTLVGIFAIGKAPTGDKDPYALRRACIGVLRTVIEGQLTLELPALLPVAAKALAGKATVSEDTLTTLRQFIETRFNHLMQESGYALPTIKSILSVGISDYYDASLRLTALHQFLDNPALENLSAANKRVNNILSKNPITATCDKDLLAEDVEKTLFNAIETLAPDVEKAANSKQYDHALAKLATLREPIDSFFESVMVMADDESLRNNRLALLTKLQKLFIKVADISCLS